MLWIADGIYGVEGFTPAYGPNEISITSIFLGVGKLDQDVAMVNYIKLCQSLGGWYGVSMQQVLELIRSEYLKVARQKSDRLLEAKQRNQRFDAQMKVYARQLLQWRLRALVTLGFSLRAGDKPVAPLEPTLDDLPEIEALTVSNYDYNVEVVAAGFARLEEDGLVDIIVHDGRDDLIVFPTERLLIELKSPRKPRSLM